MDLRAQSSQEEPATPELRARRDLIAIGVIVLIVCILILIDPDRAFEWIAQHEEVQIDEFLTAIVVVGAGFAIFSWRRWTDLSRQVAEYKRLQAELSEINRGAALLGETDDLLQSSLTTEEAYRIVIRHFEIRFPWASGAIFSLLPGQDMVEVAASWGQPSIRQTQLELEDCWALRRGRVNLSQADDPRLACAHINNPLPAYAICVPMMAHGDTLGILYLDSGTDAAKARPFAESHQRVIKILAEHLSLTVANLNLRETLRTQSIHDPLTGLFNRRYMEEALERELHRSSRRGTPLAILMVDLDHFKRFNDTYGHAAGDAALRELARVFQTQLRAEDIASRYGGEEFLIILPENDRTTAWECAERLRRAVEEIHFQHYGEMLEGLRLSIGGACYPQDGTTTETLERVADSALYRAKQEGRNRVVIPEPPRRDQAIHAAKMTNDAT
ncbi:MAG TPA: sensor domain-containing diguanylate cyclase [Granulicella sp.]